MIDGVLQGLVPDNAVVVLDYAGVSTDRVSKHYEVPYSVQPVPGGQLARWRSAEAGSELHLPAPNEFIAEDVSLVPVARDNPAVPAVALTAQRQKIWFAQDEEFRIPRGATYINFRSPEVVRGAEQTAAAVLYTSVLKDEVNEFTYPALLAGLNFSLYKHAQGISLRLSGYDDKQLVLLERLLQVIADPAFDPGRFDNIRRDMIRSLENHVAKRPSSQVIADLREAVLYGHWGEQALIDALQEMSLDDLKAFAGRFWAGATAEAMIYGNYTPDTAQQVSQLLSDLLPSSAAPELPALQVLKLAPGEAIQYPVDVLHNDSVVAWYLQGADNSWADRAATAMTAQVMKSGFFDQLRTEQQLGYIVSTFAWPQLDVPGMVMLVQSPVANAATVSDAMEAFMAGVEPALDEAQFARHQAALVSEILRPHKNLWERAEFYWQSIAKKQWDFDSRHQLAAAVEALTLDDWLAYYRQVFLQQRHSLQVVAPGQWGVLPAGEHRVVESAEALKAGHDVYQIE
jgi:secreted Zn-dependent insulinase-like peptidase